MVDINRIIAHSGWVHEHCSKLSTFDYECASTVASDPDGKTFLGGGRQGYTGNVYGGQVYHTLDPEYNGQLDVEGRFKDE